MFFEVIVAPEVERLAHSLNVSLRKKRLNVRSKTRRFRQYASQSSNYRYARIQVVTRLRAEQRYNWEILCQRWKNTNATLFRSKRPLMLSCMFFFWLSHEQFRFVAVSTYRVLTVI